MKRASVDSGIGGDPGREYNLDRRELCDRGVVPQLANGIVTPAVCRSARCEGAAVSPTRVHRDKGYSGRGIGQDGCEPVGRGAIAQLAGDVETPAICGTGVRQTASVTTSGAHGGERDSGWRHNADRRQSVGHGSVAETAVRVPPPAIDLAAGRDCTRVLATSAHGPERDARGGLRE